MGLEDSSSDDIETKQLMWYGHIRRQQLAQTSAGADATKVEGRPRVRWKREEWKMASGCDVSDVNIPIHTHVCM